MTKLKSLFSIDEFKMSSLVISLMICLALSVYCVVAYQDIPSGLKDIIITIIIGISGINCASSFSRNKSEGDEKK